MSAQFADESSSSLFVGPLFVDHRYVEYNEVSREICKLKAEQESKQKRTFTKWINAQLRTHWSRTVVVDLYVDIRSGVMLCYLIETVTDRKLAVNAGRKMKRIHHISNFNMVLSVLRQYGLELVNNNPVDLANGNPPIVLGLIWQIILHFEIKRTVLWLLKNDISGVIHNAGELSVEKWLLQWLRNEIAGKYKREVDDLDRNWKDGVLFNALIHHADPTLVDMTAVRRHSDGRRNLEHAFTVAEERLHIPRLLDLDDVDCAQPDKRSIMTYLVQFLRKTADRREKNSNSEDRENACAASGIDSIRAAGEREDNHFAATGPLSGPLCREDIGHQLRIIQMWIETTNAFLARQTATAAALSEQIDAIMNHQAQMSQIEHVLLFIEHAPKLLRSDEASSELSVTKRQYYNVTKPAIPAKLKALKVIKPQLTTLDEKWVKLTRCLKHVADSIEADEDIDITNGDLKEIAEDLATAQILTDSICQPQNDQHVNAPIIMEKTRQLCTQFDLLKVQLSGEIVEEELASFHIAEKAVNELIGSLEREISADSKECTSDVRARAPSFAFISTYPVLFDIGRVNSEMVGKIDKMRQAAVHISDKNTPSVEERISTADHKWAGVVEQLNAFNDRIRQQMKRDEHVASCRSQYDICRNELEYRLDRFEQLCAKQKHLRRSQIFLQATDALTDLKQQEQMFVELEELKQLLQRQRQLLANLNPLITPAELSEAKQGIVGFELRLDLQAEEIGEQIEKRMAGLSFIRETEQWIRSVRDGRGTVVVGGVRKELLKTLISEAEGRMAQFAESKPEETIRLLASQAQEGLESVQNDLKQQLALVEYNEWSLAGIDRQLKQVQDWTEMTLVVCRAAPASPRSALHQLKHIERLIAQLPGEYSKFIALKAGCPTERTNVVRQLDGEFNDIRIKLITAKQDLGRYIESCDYLAQTVQWLNATEHKLADLELVAEMDVSVAFEVLNDVRKDVDDRRSTVDAIIEQQPAIQYPAASIRQRMSEISAARVAQCESILNRKLDMFQQLEQLADFYQSARRTESALGIVPVSQTTAARVENSSLARELNDTLNSVGELQTEVDSLQAKFFQTECDRIRERYYFLIGQLRQVLDRCDQREEYFETLSNVSDLTSVPNTDDETIKQLFRRDHSSSPSTVIESTLVTEEQTPRLNESTVDNATAKLPRLRHPQEAMQRRVENEQGMSQNFPSRPVHVQLSFAQELLQPGKLASFPNDSYDDSADSKIAQKNSDVHGSSSKQRFSPASELLRERSAAEAAGAFGASASTSDEGRQRGTLTRANELTNTSLPHSTNYVAHPAAQEQGFSQEHGSTKTKRPNPSAVTESHNSAELPQEGRNTLLNGSTDKAQFQMPTASFGLATQRRSPAAELTKKNAVDDRITPLELQGKHDAMFMPIHNSTEDSVACSKENLEPNPAMANGREIPNGVGPEPLESGKDRQTTSAFAASGEAPRQNKTQAFEAAKDNKPKVNKGRVSKDGTFVQATEIPEYTPESEEALIDTLCIEFTSIMTTIHEQIESFTQRMKMPNVTQAELQQGMNDLINGQQNVHRIRRSIPSAPDGDDLKKLVDRELAEIGRHVETFNKFIDELNQREKAFVDQIDECSNRVSQMGEEKEKMDFAARTTADNDPEKLKQLASSLVEAQEEMEDIRATAAELAANCRNAHTASLIGVLQADVDQLSNEFKTLENQVQANLIATKGYQAVADKMSTLDRALTAASTILNDESAAHSDIDTTLQKLQKSRVDLEEVERAYKDIPNSSQHDELRAKLGWDLSKQRECMNNLTASLQDRSQLYADYLQQSNAACKELDDIETVVSGETQTKKNKKKKRKNLSKKEQIEQTENALARLAAHEKKVKELRQLASELLPSKAPMTAVEQIESKNAALSKAYEERLAELRKADDKSQSSDSKGEAHAGSKAESAEKSQRESSRKNRIIGAIKKTLASAGISKPNSNDPSSSSTQSKKVVGSDSAMETASEKQTKDTASKKSEKNTASKKAGEDTALENEAMITALEKVAKDTASKKAALITASEKLTKNNASENRAMDTVSEKPAKNAVSENPATVSASKNSAKNTASKNPAMATASETPALTSASENLIIVTASEKLANNAASEKAVQDTASKNPAMVTASEKPAKNTASENLTTVTALKKPAMVAASEQSAKVTASDYPNFTTDTASIMKNTNDSSKRVDDWDGGKSGGLIEEQSTDAMKERNELGLANFMNFKEANTNSDVIDQYGIPIKKAADSENTTKMDNEEKTIHNLGLNDQRARLLGAKQIDGEKTEKVTSKQAQKFIITPDQNESQIKNLTIEMDKENNAEYEVGIFAKNEDGSSAFPNKEEDSGMLISIDLLSNSDSSNNAQHIRKKMAEPVPESENIPLKKRPAKNRHVSFQQDIISEKSHQMDNRTSLTTSMQKSDDQDKEIGHTHLASSADEHPDTVEIQVEDIRTFPPTQAFSQDSQTTNVRKKMAEPVPPKENDPLIKRTAKKRQVSFEQDTIPERAHQMDNGINHITSVQELEGQDEENGYAHRASSVEERLHIIDTDMQVEETRAFPSRFSCGRYRCVLLPLLGLLFAFLLLALLLPYCEDDWCRWTSSFRRGLEPVVDFVDGPPPV